MTIETGICLAGPNPVPTATDTGVTVAVTHNEVALDPITDPHTAAYHATEAQAHIVTDETHQNRSSSCRSFSRDNSRSRPHTSHKHHHKTSTRPSSSSNQMTQKTKNKEHKQVTIDDTPSEYCSSDEQASNSEDDLN